MRKKSARKTALHRSFDNDMAYRNKATFQNSHMPFVPFVRAKLTLTRNAVTKNGLGQNFGEAPESGRINDTTARVQGALRQTAELVSVNGPTFALP